MMLHQNQMDIKQNQSTIVTNQQSLEVIQTDFANFKNSALNKLTQQDSEM